MAKRTRFLTPLSALFSSIYRVVQSRIDDAYTPQDFWRLIYLMHNQQHFFRREQWPWEQTMEDVESSRHRLEHPLWTLEWLSQASLYALQVSVPNRCSCLLLLESPRHLGNHVKVPL